MLDNSGSMSETRAPARARSASSCSRWRPSSSSTRSPGRRDCMKQISKPVQFAWCRSRPRSMSARPRHDATWMDTHGISPVHHENFDWPLNLGTNKISNAAPSVFKKGTGWGTAERNQMVTRFTLFKETSSTHQTAPETLTARRYASWQGCVEARPYPYNVNDAKPSAMSDGSPRSQAIPRHCSCRCSRRTKPAMPGRHQASPASTATARRTAGGTTCAATSADGSTRQSNIAEILR